MDNNTYNEDRQDNITPPYISLPRMQKLIEILGTRSFSQLELSDLVNRGFPKSEAFQSLQALKFLGLIDKEGKVMSAQIQALALRGDARRSGLKALVIKAYHKLFDRLQEPQKLNKDELYNEFIAEYKLSPRLTRSALPIFLWLCQESGMETVEIITLRVNKKNKSSSVIKNSPSQNNKTNYQHTDQKEDLFTSNQKYHNLEIANIRISIPKNPKVDLLIAEGGLVEITQKIKEFSQKVSLTEENLKSTKNGEVA